MTNDDLVQRLFAEADNFKVDREVGVRGMLYRAADRIEQLEREKAVVSDLWEQQKEIALDYLADCNKAAERIEAQAAQSDAPREALEAAPLIGRTESVNDFMARQDAWLKGPYRAALQEQSK